MMKQEDVIPIQLIPDVLTEAEVAAIEAECGHYEFRDAAAIEALKLVQKNRRWIDDDCLIAIANLLGMSSAQLEGVATFYNHIYRQPVGRHVIHLCDSIACHLHRYQELAEQLRQLLNIEFGETTEDGLFTLLTNPCLGACDKAPALMLDGEIIEQLSKETVAALIQRLKHECEQEDEQHG